LRTAEKLISQISTQLLAYSRLIVSALLSQISLYEGEGKEYAC